MKQKHLNKKKFRKVETVIFEKKFWNEIHEQGTIE